MDFRNQDAKIQNNSNLNNTVKVIKRNDSHESRHSGLRFDIKSSN